MSVKIVSRISIIDLSKSAVLLELDVVVTIVII